MGKLSSIGLENSKKRSFSLRAVITLKTRSLAAWLLHNNSPQTTTSDEWTLTTGGDDNNGLEVQYLAALEAGLL